MEGWKNWRTLILTAFAAAGLIVLAAPEVRADTLQPSPAKRMAKLDTKALVEALQSEWEAVREDLTRSALEATMTLFVGRWGKSPSPPKAQGETPPPPPPIDPPPHGTPEPASLVSALLGTGLMSLFALRRRRKNLAVSR